MFNNKPAAATPPAAPQHVSPDRSVPLQERVEALEATLRKHGVELPELRPLAKVFTGSSFATRKAEADARNAARKPRVVSLGVSTERGTTIRRGQYVPVEREIEMLMDVTHGARLYRREVGTGEDMEPIRGGR